MNALSIIPQSDMLLYSQLTETQRGEFRLWSLLMQEIESRKCKSRAMVEIAKRYHGVKALSAGNIRTKFYAYKSEGWKALINKAKCSRNSPVAPAKSAQIGQPPAFVEYWKGLQESFQRSSKAAYRELIRRYRNGDSIPAIGTWRTVWIERLGGMPPATCPLDAPLPEGWGARNLARYKPTKFELAATRIGRSASDAFRPLVYQTRAGMAVGQIYVFDDVWHDNKVNYIGINRTAMRPLEFSCLDLFSGCQIAWGAQPMTESEETGRRETLRESEMRFLLAHVLCTLGYHKAGCCLHVEHGTAAVREELAGLLFDWTAGAVKVERGGIHGAATHDGFFVGRGKGNSRFKAALESHHNLKHNELAALPGQVGKDRLHSPDELHGRDEYNKILIKAMSQLPAHRADLLRMPFLDFTQWKQIVGEVYERINRRIDHDLEGWEQSGLIATEYRLSEASAWEPMLRLLDLPAERRAAVETLIDAPGMVRMRKLSPAEVWASGRADLVRLGAHYVPLILGERNAKPLRIQDDHTITFQDRRIGPGIHRYLAQAERPDGAVEMLQPGSSVLIYATPFDVSAVFVASDRNEFIGVARRLQTACKTDSDAIHRQIGKAMHFEKELLAPVRMRHADKAVAKQQMHQHNAAVLAGDPITPDEFFRQERIAESSPDADDFAAATAHGREIASEFSHDQISDLFRSDGSV